MRLKSNSRKCARPSPKRVFSRNEAFVIRRNRTGESGESLPVESEGCYFEPAEQHARFDFFPVAV
jgi:hypothetical protein